MDDLLEDAPCGFIVFDDEGIIRRANATLADWLGLGSASLTGSRFESLLTIAGRIFYQTHFFPLITLHGKAEEIFLTLKGKDGIEVPVLVNAKRKLRHDSTPENHCVAIPVYQRKKFEQELIQAKRTAEEALQRNELLLQAQAELETSKQELDRQVRRLSLLNQDLAQFSDVISHDVQEPIRKIAMFADIIRREEDARISEVSKLSLDKIGVAGNRMRRLISSLQQFVSVDTSSSAVEPCNLNKIIRQARLKVIIDFQYQNFEIDAAALPEVEGRCEQLELLFYHLILNAVQFRKEGEPARITVVGDIVQHNSFTTIKGKYRYIDFLRIKFSDSGRGFNPEYAEYIFQLFRKGHADTPGLGFGLALCRKIVENHYGSITARGEEGKGASFILLLPLKQS